VTDRNETQQGLAMRRLLFRPNGMAVMWSWREELREVAWLALIVAGLSTLAVSLAVAVAVV
jgi:hypothetical protein